MKTLETQVHVYSLNFLVSYWLIKIINFLYNILQCLRDNVELLCNAAEMFYNAGDCNNAKSFFQRVIFFL